MNNKNKILKKLKQISLLEDNTPGISIKNAISKENKKSNEAGLSKMTKDLTDYEKSLGKNEAESNKVTNNKFNYSNDKEVEYHNEIEIANGMEMLEYDREPSKRFKERAKESIKGSTKMGNKGGKEVGNAQETFGASSDKFGDEFIKTTKKSFEKRLDAETGLTSFGDDIETLPKEGKENRIKHSMFENKINNKTNQGMKRLNFKKQFNGLGNALKLIPESYKTNNKVFEMTDGNENYRIRWEGQNNGRPVVLVASDKKLVNEDINRMKELFGYKSQETLGTVKGKARIDENNVFNDMLDKTKKLMNEGSDMEGVKANEGNWDGVKKKAPEATKHIKSSVSKDAKIATAKAGNPDGATKHAPEAKKPFKSSSNKNIETQADYNEGQFDDVVKKSPEATKHVMGKSKKVSVEKTDVKKTTNMKQAPEAKKHIKESEYMGANERLELEELDYMDENMYENMYEEMHENYPLGADEDPDAPWNRDDEYDDDDDDRYGEDEDEYMERMRNKRDKSSDDEVVYEIEMDDEFDYADSERTFFNKEDLEGEEDDEIEDEESEEEDDEEVSDKKTVDDEDEYEIELDVDNKPTIDLSKSDEIDSEEEDEEENIEKPMTSLTDGTKLLRNTDNPNEFIVKKGREMFNVPEEVYNRYRNSSNRAERIFNFIKDNESYSGLD